MSEELSTDVRLKEAVKTVAKLLEERGVLREPALAIAKQHEERIFVSSRGMIRVASSAGSFYVVASEGPFAQLVAELYRAVPATDKASVSAEDQEAMKRRLRASGQY